MEREDRDDCILASSYARLHVKEVPRTVASKLCQHAQTMPIIACGLLQHESKMSVLHFRYAFFSCFLGVSHIIHSTIDCIMIVSLIFHSIKKHETYDLPIKAKEELIFHVGFRQFVAR